MQLVLRLLSGVVYLLHASIAKYLNKTVTILSNATLRLSPERTLVVDGIRHCYHLVLKRKYHSNCPSSPLCFHNNINIIV